MTKRTSAVLDALGDPTRRRVLKLLAKRPHSVREIANKLPITRPAVSHHLRVLKKAKLVRAQARGTRRIYHLESEGLEEVQAFLEDVWGQALARLKLVADNVSHPRKKPRV